MIKEAACIITALFICAENKLPPEPDSVIPEMAVSYAHIDEDIRETETNLHMIEVLLHKRGLIEAPEQAVIMARNKE